jgi:hypothetical protein
MSLGKMPMFLTGLLGALLFSEVAVLAAFSFGELDIAVSQ